MSHINTGGTEANAYAVSWTASVGVVAGRYSPHSERPMQEESSRLG